MNCMKESDQTKSTVAYHAIAKVAYQLWEEAGRPDGRAVEHWLEAEARLRVGGTGAQQTRAASVPTVPTSPGQARGVRYGLVLSETF
jgi:DUF2934 family protein